MIHKGQIVEKKVRQSGLSVKSAADRLGVSRTTLYKYFQNANLSDQIINSIGKELNISFSKEIPDIGKVVEEEMAEYYTGDPRCQKAVELKNKYIELYTQASERLSELYEQNIDLQKQNTLLKVENERLKKSA